MSAEQLCKRLRASIRMDAINGDSHERAVCAKQMKEAADEIERLRARIAELEKALRESPCQCHEAQGNGRDACARCEALRLTS